MQYLEAVILGIIQGITEWIPISSSGIVSFISLRFFERSVQEAFYFSFWLHIGTVLASCVYFRKDLVSLVKEVPLYLQKKGDGEKRDLFSFLLYSTLLSGILGGLFLFFHIERFLQNAAFAMLFIGLLLVVTGILQLVAKKRDLHRRISSSDGWLLGLVQSFSVIPGLSRSGITISTLLFKKYSSDQALRLSFLMSIPVIFGAEIVLGFFDVFQFRFVYLLSALVSFLVGLLSISALMKVARKINFGWFCILLGILSMISLTFL